MDTRLVLIMNGKDGPRALQAWSQAWASARVHLGTALLWTGALVRPFFKSNGHDVRPVLCSEALVKLALGSTVDSSQEEVVGAMGPQQFGGGRSGGAHLEVEQIRAAAAAHPDRALVGLDVANAFGSVEWADALEEPGAGPGSSVGADGHHPLHATEGWILEVHAGLRRPIPRRMRWAPLLLHTHCRHLAAGHGPLRPGLHC